MSLQFYHKAMRPKLRDQLWIVPSHKRCNESCKRDEEYCYHRSYPLVRFQNETMDKVMLDDIKRRAMRPQSRVIVRHMLKKCKKVTLPYCFQLPFRRLQAH